MRLAPAPERASIGSCPTLRIEQTKPLISKGFPGLHRDAQTGAIRWRCQPAAGRAAIACCRYLVIKFWLIRSRTAAPCRRGARHTVSTPRLLQAEPLLQRAHHLGGQRVTEHDCRHRTADTDVRPRHYPHATWPEIE